MRKYEKRNEKIKILQFTVAASKGGRTQYILNIWNQIDRSKFQFDFVTFSKELDFEEMLVKQGSQVYHIQNYPENNIEAFKKEFSKVLKQQYDVIEIHTGLWKSTIVEEMARAAGVRKIIIHGHSAGIHTRLSAEETEKAMTLHETIKARLQDTVATDYWVCSKASQAWLFGDKIPDSKVKIIYNTIDTSRFKYCLETREKMRKALQLQNRFVFGFVGRFEPVKNIPFLIQVFKKAHEKRKDAFLLLVGDGSQVAKCKELVVNLGLENEVCFIGEQDGVEDYLQAMDVFLLPSLTEGFPIALLEAQCAGLPCFYSDVITPEVEITENVHRLPINDMERWTNSIVNCNPDKTRRGYQMELQRKGFDTASKIRKLENLYVGEVRC